MHKTNEINLVPTGMGVKEEEVETVLESVGFGEEMRGKAISSLSGGWKMKLALGASRLTTPCLLLRIELHEH